METTATNDYDLIELRATITSDCTCEIYDEDTDSTKLDEYGYPARPEYCYGDCFTETVDDFTENILKVWLDRNRISEDAKIQIVGSKMRWTGSSGWTVVPVEEIPKVLYIDGDFTLRFTLTGTELICVRSSHDELGALFQFAEYAVLEESEDVEY
jgi:hypothetical protein